MIKNFRIWNTHRLEKLFLQKQMVTNWNKLKFFNKNVSEYKTDARWVKRNDDLRRVRKKFKY